MSLPDGERDSPRAIPRWRSSWRIGRAAQTGAIAVIALALLAVLGQRLYAAQQVASANATNSTAAAPAGTTPHPTTLRTAPDFTLHTWAWWEQTHPNATDPTQVQLLALRGKPVVINFWASWCDACRAEAPTLEQAWRQYQAQGVVFVGIDVNDTATDSAAFLKQYSVTYFNAPDITESLYIKYGVIGLPTTVFVNRVGQIQSQHIGQISAAQLDAGIQAVLK